MNARRPPGYLDELDGRLAQGIARLPARFRIRQRDCLAAAQNGDGGFAGRRGGSDIYYTSFGLRAASLLDQDGVGFWERAARYLLDEAPLPADVVECFCILSSARAIRCQDAEVWRASVGPVLEQCRMADGGHAKAEGGDGSVYHTFLAALCWQILGRPMRAGSDALGFVRSCRRADGGFADGPTADAGGTNPTAAAIALLAMHEALDEATARGAAGFLAAMQRPDGGFAAHATAPVADLMSTFTALVALAECGATGLVSRAQVGRFAKSLAAPDGGFRGAPADDAVDVEYTYYGLGTLGLLSLETERGCP